MSTVNIAAKVVLMGLVGFGLLGCKSRLRYDYHVQVRNNTGGVVKSRIFRDDPERLIVVYETQVYPGDRAEIGLARRQPRERLELHVDTPNNPGTPAKMPLDPGMTYVNVTREGAEGPIKLERVN